jgi:2-keto-4-pentenoate hydratase/2-oxohepta-3-ene-1,7-dioic acid hydratase in catechol pathway
MKLLRVGEPGRERPAILDSTGVLRDARSLAPDWRDDALLPSALAQLATADLASLPAVSNAIRRGPCVAGVGKFICICLNDADHAAETGAAVPHEPVIFMKATSAICGPDDPLEIPRGSEKTDWEVELGVVISRSGRYINEADALSHVAGFCLINDVSERAFQMEGTGQWVKGKSADSFGSIGPWLLTADEVPDLCNVDLWMEVNGERVQAGNTRTMVFGVPFLVSYVSRFMSLQPGDIISTGTPPGVGMGMKPPRFLRAGDRVVAGGGGLGVQSRACVNAA